MQYEFFCYTKSLLTFWEVQPINREIDQPTDRQVNGIGRLLVSGNNKKHWRSFVFLFVGGLKSSFYSTIGVVIAFRRDTPF